MATVRRSTFRSLMNRRPGPLWRIVGLMAMTLAFAGCQLWSPSPARLPNNGNMAVGETRTAHDVSTYCGVRVLGITVAGIQWVAYDLDVDGLAPIPESWADQVDSSQNIDLEIELVSMEKLVATAIGTNDSLHYAPSTDLADCD